MYIRSLLAGAAMVLAAGAASADTVSFNTAPQHVRHSARDDDHGAVAWAMMLAGLGGLGVSLRSRRQTTFA
jgi:hypothetical protein